MRTVCCVVSVVGLTLAVGSVALAGKSKGGGGGNAAHHGGGGGAAKAMGGGGGGGMRGAGGGGMRGAGQMHANGGQHNLGGNNLNHHAGVNGGGQHGLNAHSGHGLNAVHNNHGINRGLNGHNNLHNAHLGRGVNHLGAHRFAGRGLNNHWRSGLHWRNSHWLYAGYHRSWHDRWWWHSHYNHVLFVNSPYWGGYWYWDGGYWFPAWGYDPVYTGYIYDGPIYAYANLPPDQVVVNVQEALQDQGYYTGDVDGQLGSKTRDALAAYQKDHNLEVTAAVDEPTVQALGLS